MGLGGYNGSFNLPEDIIGKIEPVLVLRCTVGERETAQVKTSNSKQGNEDSEALVQVARKDFCIPVFGDPTGKVLNLLLTLH